jgi:hypothetical protein
MDLQPLLSLEEEVKEEDMLKGDQLINSFKFIFNYKIIIITAAETEERDRFFALHEIEEQYFDEFHQKRKVIVRNSRFYRMIARMDADIVDTRNYLRFMTSDEEGDKENLSPNAYDEKRTTTFQNRHMMANMLVSSDEEDNYRLGPEDFHLHWKERVKKQHVLLRKKFIEKTNLYRFRINESDDSDDNLPLTQLVEKRNNKESNKK